VKGRARIRETTGGIVSSLAMATFEKVAAALETIAPLRLAAEWDAVGLLVGSRRPGIDRVMTCLSLTPEVACEAVRERADLVVTHHPLPFRPVDRITDGSATGSVLLELVGAGIAIWSAHTAWDSAAGGINDQLAALVPLEHVAPIEPDDVYPLAGFGRAGGAPAGCSVEQLARRLAERLGARAVQVAGDAGRPAGRVGIVCGSGGESITAVKRAGCQTLVTGEIKLHGALEALAADLAVVAVGHHASERFSMEALAARLAAMVPGMHCWASRDEADPLRWIAGSREPAR
jgi:dinuclear metal center YbgI/SA1388 family protein